MHYPTDPPRRLKYTQTHQHFHFRWRSHVRVRPTLAPGAAARGRRAFYAEINFNGAVNSSGCGNISGSDKAKIWEGHLRELSIFFPPSAEEATPPLMNGHQSYKVQSCKFFSWFCKFAVLWSCRL